MTINGLLDLVKKGVNVSTDTRKIRKGDVFFALKGENFNGNQYAAQALESGAIKAVVDEPDCIPDKNPDYILVPNVLKCLQDLAKAYRQSFSIPIIGLTGSNGKTTSKELVQAVLARAKRVHATAGNFNNHIGVPLTLLAMPADTEIGVVEMGANQPGDIEELVNIALPSCGYITNIGTAHIERLGSQEGVFEEKTSLFRYLSTNEGRIWLNLDDPWLSPMQSELKNYTSFGTKTGDYHLGECQLFADRSMVEVVLPDGTRLNILTHLIGRHNLSNVLLAVAIGDHFGIPHDEIEKGISSYKPKNNRTELISKGGLSILMDAYNANPSSMKASIDAIFELQYEKVGLILGDMFELGAQSDELHRKLGEEANAHQPHITIGIGAAMSGAIEKIEGPKAWYLDAQKAGPEIFEQVKDCDIVLIKGSRGMALEKLLDYMG